MRISVELKNKLRSMINGEIDTAKSVCHIQTAHEITENEKREIVKSFPALDGHSINTTIDKSLIAGFILTVGSTKYDYSLKSKILDTFKIL